MLKISALFTGSYSGFEVLSMHNFTFSALMLMAKVLALLLLKQIMYYGNSEVCGDNFHKAGEMMLMMMECCGVTDRTLLWTRMRIG